MRKLFYKVFNLKATSILQGEQTCISKIKNKTIYKYRLKPGEQIQNFKFFKYSYRVNKPALSNFKGGVTKFTGNLNSKTHPKTNTIKFSLSLLGVWHPCNYSK